MSEPSKVISVRIPCEVHAEILFEALMHNITISEWIIVQFALVKEQQENLDNIIEDVKNCEHEDCPLAAKLRNFLNDSNSDL